MVRLFLSPSWLFPSPNVDEDSYFEKWDSASDLLNSDHLFAYKYCNCNPWRSPISILQRTSLRKIYRRSYLFTVQRSAFWSPLQSEVEGSWLMRCLMVWASNDSDFTVWLLLGVQSGRTLSWLLSKCREGEGWFVIFWMFMQSMLRLETFWPCTSC